MNVQNTIPNTEEVYFNENQKQACNIFYDIKEE